MTRTVSTIPAQLDGVLHALQRNGQKTYTICSQDPLQADEVPLFTAPDGDRWKPEEHERACLTCFDSPSRHVGTPPTPESSTSNDPEVSCPDCSKPFSTPQGLKIHRGQKHKPVDQASGPQTIPKAEPPAEVTTRNPGKPGANETEGRGDDEAPAGLRIVQLLVEARHVDEVLDDVDEDLDDVDEDLDDVDEDLDDVQLVEAVEFWRLQVTLPNDEAWSRDGIWDQLREILDDAGYPVWTIGDPVALKLVPIKEASA